MRPDELISLMAEKYDVSIEQMASPSRVRRLNEPRRVVWHILHRGGMSLVEIGQIFNRDHTTIAYGLAQLNLQIADRRVKIPKVDGELALHVIQSRLDTEMRHAFDTFLAKMKAELRRDPIGTLSKLMGALERGIRD